jgi:hypothetical protein
MASKLLSLFNWPLAVGEVRLNLLNRASDQLDVVVVSRWRDVALCSGLRLFLNLCIQYPGPSLNLCLCVSSIAILSLSKQTL